MQMPVSVCPATLISANATAEADLVERAKRDREAFAALYRRHYARIAGYIFRRTGDEHVTEDLVAEVFLAAMRYLPRYRHRGTPVQAWLYRIATNEVNRWARRERRQARRLIGRSEDVVDAAATPAGDDGRHEAHHARLAMKTLSPKHQAALALFYFEGLSIEEVAATLGCRVGTVKSRLSRGRDALRAALERIETRNGSLGDAMRRAAPAQRVGDMASADSLRQPKSRTSGRTSS